MNLNPFVNTFSLILTLYSYVLFAYIVIQWLAHFKIINLRQPFMWKVFEVLSKLVEPVLNKIRPLAPKLGGIDISSIILMLLIYFIQQVLYSYIYNYGV